MSDAAQPLVTCIMPTYNRRRFVARAIEYFARQDYAGRELIVVDDGDDAVADLIPEGVRYIRLDTRHTIGAKRNLACAQARGRYILHWDDDDWHAPWRVRYQVEAMERTGADLCGIRDLLYYDVRTGDAWRFVYPPTQRAWLSGNALGYTRAFWDAHHFPEIDIGEDTRFVFSAEASKMHVLPDSRYHVSTIHGGNVSPKETASMYWQRCPVEEIRAAMGDDWKAFEAAPADTAPLTIARNAHLGLAEFAACNHKRALPWMRRWELPFALFQARLGNTPAILDCTINPAGFGDLVKRLYSHSTYCHTPAIRDAAFARPLGVPDASFDAVVCVNTLEHLVEAQRRTLLDDMAAKLKPGGRLVLAADSYFDSSWRDPHFLSAGVLRADRQETFNGWNAVRAAEWHDAAARLELEVVALPAHDPEEGDPTLYLQRAPHSHATIAAVLRRPGPDTFPRRKVVLAMLTWNTRDVSVDSVRAYVHEARMLQRLGHDALLCLCDNGSNDGTVEALRAMEAEIDVPYRLLLNERNLGNAVARNQMIDCALEWGADYILFMDGDIEVVPFSSFAMLRHMENHGRQLGCIGADSHHQTRLREQASPYLFSVAECRVEPVTLVAWTQYGLFRAAMFRDGVRFDERPPFDGPGWGFEDNDLAFQMQVKGYVNQRFLGMTYLHRDARSSIRNLRQEGQDVHGLYARRKQYVVDKWADVPAISRGPLVDVRRAHIPL